MSSAEAFTLAEYERHANLLHTSNGGRRRRKPPKSVQDSIIARTGGRCEYCHLSVIGSRLRLHWDHFVPYAYLGDNPDENWILSCHVCNGIKGPMMFDTMDDACEFIASRRQDEM